MRFHPPLNDSVESAHCYQNVRLLQQFVHYQWKPKLTRICLHSKQLELLGQSMRDHWLLLDSWVVFLWSRLALKWERRFQFHGVLFGAHRDTFEIMWMDVSWKRWNLLHFTYILSEVDANGRYGVLSINDSAVEHQNNKYITSSMTHWFLSHVFRVRLERND